MTYETIKRGVGVVTLLLLLLALTACGASTPTSGSGDQMNTPHTSDGASAAPGGMDSPVQGQPGQPGGPAVGSVVEGVVTDASGKPVVGASVVPQSVDTPPQAVPELGVFTNEQGHFSWSLQPGKYVFAINANGVTTTTEPVTVSKDQPAKVNVTLK
jgi:Carboxypeptidase regulatory-like domain